MVLLDEDSPEGDLPGPKDGNSEGQAGHYRILEEPWPHSGGEEKEHPCNKDDDDDDDDVYQVFEEFDFSQLPDMSSTVSDDSFYPPSDSFLLQRCLTPESPETLTFFKACCNNNAIIVKIMIRQGVTEQEVKEVDKNNRTGLIVACYHGYVDVVVALAQCPYVDVNWQDSEGNTALMVAAQAGHAMITSHLLNYFAELDVERRNGQGFTALMKAALQGQEACVRVIMMSGGDAESRDCGRQLTAHEWALLTGRYDTARLILRLKVRPRAERFCLSFCTDWLGMCEPGSLAAEPMSCWKGLWPSASLWLWVETRQQRTLDHVVHMTTALSSLLVATGRLPAGIPPSLQEPCPPCRNPALSAGTPPCVGKLCPSGPKFMHGRSPALDPPRGWFLSPLPGTMAMCRNVRRMLCTALKSSVHPAMPLPHLRLCRTTPTTHTPETWAHRGSRDPHHLQVPDWKYSALGDGRW